MHACLSCINGIEKEKGPAPATEQSHEVPQKSLDSDNFRACKTIMGRPLITVNQRIHQRNA